MVDQFYAWYIQSFKQEYTHGIWRGILNYDLAEIAINLDSGINPNLVSTLHYEKFTGYSLLHFVTDPNVIRLSGIRRAFIVQMLLISGANPNVTIARPDKKFDDVTPLCLAQKSDFFDVTQVLLLAGSNKI